MATPALEVIDIHKSFPGARALRGVSMSVGEGEVHALLGENGAGKSTLIKIISGAQPADSGEIRVNGVALTRANPRAAQALGVRVIHQERQVALHLSVAENLLLDTIPAGVAGIVTRRRTERVAAQRLAALGIDLDPAAPASSLGVAQQQLLELARAVSFDARLVIMDEPTASLHREEVETLFGIVRRLRDHGVAVLFISHHIDEVFAVSERVTVLRDGTVAGSRDLAGTDAEELISLIFGHNVDMSRREVRAGVEGENASAEGDVVVAARGLAYQRSVRGVDVEVRSGEILALTGAQGSGASEVAQLLAGCLKPTEGTITHVHADRHLKDRTQHTRSGVAYLPADRKRQGLLLGQTVRENILLSRLAMRGEWITRFGRNHKRASAEVRRLAIKTKDLDVPVRVLSGGNQQKCILGRWLEIGSRLFVFEEPTAGVDINSKLELYRLLTSAAREGAAVVMVSSDYEEIAAVADRVMVMRNGTVVGEVQGDDVAAGSLMRLEVGV